MRYRTTRGGHIAKSWYLHNTGTCSYTCSTSCSHWRRFIHIYITLYILHSKLCNICRRRWVQHYKENYLYNIIYNTPSIISAMWSTRASETKIGQKSTVNDPARIRIARPIRFIIIVRVVRRHYIIILNGNSMTKNARRRQPPVGFIDRRRRRCRRWLIPARWIVYDFRLYTCNYYVIYNI